MANQAKQLRKLEEHLEDNEKVQHSVYGAYEMKIMGKDSVRNGIFAATDKRLIFFAKKVTGYDMEVFPYSNISSIEMGKNMMGNHISIFASGNKSSMKWIKTKDVAAFVSYVKDHIGRKSGEASVSPNSDDSLEQLEKLAALKEKGIITQKEFDAKKKKLLDL